MIGMNFMCLLLHYSVLHEILHLLQTSKNIYFHCRLWIHHSTNTRWPDPVYHRLFIRDSDYIAHIKIHR